MIHILGATSKQRELKYGCVLKGKSTISGRKKTEMRFPGFRSTPVRDPTE
jgi:hypothetical protein